MKEYISLFETTAAYNTAKNNLDLPNVAYCKDQNKVHYAEELSIIVTINITKTNSATTITHDTDNVSKVIIDGEDVGVVDSYQFSTTGIHTIKFILTTPQINSMMFYGEEVETEWEDIMWEQIPLTSVIISNGITTIGSDAFGFCHSLTSVTIGKDVQTISQLAFEFCENLTSINLPRKLTNIYSSAFSGCSGLTSIKVENGNTKYDSRNNCNAVIETSTNKLVCGCKNTIIPNTVKIIAESAFYYCTGLTSITIPYGVISIGLSAFRNCSGLTSISIPNSVTSIGGYAFHSCSSLSSITIPNSVLVINDNTFYNCSGLTSIIIPDGMNSIGQYAFYNCSSLTSIVSNAIVQPSIKNNTFRNVKTGGVLTVPTGSNYSNWMSTSNYYLGLYNWTKVEQ